MNTCFVMQPFDRGVFDQRYEETIKPAILEANLEPYRVDQDPKAAIPIEDIERGIRRSAICLAEITKDNPNVWYELGYAFACGKQVVLICSDERESKFPFDVQHRTIIPYNTGAPSDFIKLQNEITKKLNAYLERSSKLSTASEISKVTDFEGLTPHEVMCLATVGENLGCPSAHEVQNDMEQNGFTKVASAMAIRKLIKKGFLETKRCAEDYGNYDEYTGYSLSDSGWEWVIENQDKFVLQQPKQDTYAPQPKDDIPF